MFSSTAKLPQEQLRSMFICLSDEKAAKGPVSECYGSSTVLTGSKKEASLSYLTSLKIISLVFPVCITCYALALTKCAQQTPPVPHQP